ncbi:hypothetical protein DOTSEDRAFT_56447 [Dothistroma septosporum NZE10]|uniref:DUF7730 domain-containing protein n=1 Tax=Dothistroma septosporum (strain NZE10 / CBS 128990) TaxID=675120 RepID=N1PFZ3_DOTSN|nr:hypothetical protein DOTSEDRAFT_56447 [Dothistroma septosporum NZE10]
MAPSQVIDLTDDTSDHEASASAARQMNPAAHDQRKDHRAFWARFASGPQQHGVKRIRDYARPRRGDDCPFLELAPEVRNRIYEYALGGHNINHKNLLLDAKLPHDASNKFKVDTYAHRHVNCLIVDTLDYDKVAYRKIPPRLAMGLLRTCKQVYNEAALIPSYDNTFSSVKGADLDFFVSSVLTAKQQAALQHVQHTQEGKEIAHLYTRPGASIPKKHFGDLYLFEDLR